MSFDLNTCLGSVVTKGAFLELYSLVDVIDMLLNAENFLVANIAFNS